MSCMMDLRKLIRRDLETGKTEVLAYRGNSISRYFFVQFFDHRKVELLLIYNNSYVKKG